MHNPDKQTGLGKCYVLIQFRLKETCQINTEWGGVGWGTQLSLPFEPLSLYRAATLDRTVLLSTFQWSVLQDSESVKGKQEQINLAFISNKEVLFGEFRLIICVQSFVYVFCLLRRSVLEKPIAEASIEALDRPHSRNRGQVFPNTDQARPTNNLYIFFFEKLIYRWTGQLWTDN